MSVNSGFPNVWGNVNTIMQIAFEIYEIFGKDEKGEDTKGIQMSEEQVDKILPDSTKALAVKEDGKLSFNTKLGEDLVAKELIEQGIVKDKDFIEEHKNDTVLNEGNIQEKQQENAQNIEEVEGFNYYGNDNGMEL